MKRTFIAAGIVCLAAAAIGCDMPSMNWGGSSNSLDETEEGFTVLLGWVRGEGHARDAKLKHRSIAAETGWDDIFVVGQSGYSYLCRGRYSSINKAEKAVKTCRAYLRPRQTRGPGPFHRATVIRLPGARVGPKSWDLTEQKGTYTLEVATFYDVPEAKYVGRKKFAVDYCRQLREEGYKAYYYHGPSRSSVTVGNWPAKAVAVKRDDKGRVVYDPLTKQPVKVIVNEQIKRYRNSEKFKYRALNGRQEKVRAIDPDTRRPVMVPQRSYLIRIEKAATPKPQAWRARFQ